MAAAIATIASNALPPSAMTERPASTAAWCGAATTPRRWPAVWRSVAADVMRKDASCRGLAHHCSMAQGVACDARDYQSAGELESGRTLHAHAHHLRLAGRACRRSSYPVAQRGAGL